MQYFILPDNETTPNLMNENYLLGEQSFKVFWAGSGFQRLNRIIDQAPDILEHFKIIDEKGTAYSVEDFLDKIKKLQIRTQ